MDVIDKHLATSARSNSYEPSIKAALTIGKNVLNKYYNLTDNSELYRIAIGKFQYYYFIIFTVVESDQQLFTRATSFNTSSWQDGTRCGSRLRRKLCAWNLSVLMLDLKSTIRIVIIRYYYFFSFKFLY
jgi:hypothetical protein